MYSWIFPFAIISTFVLVLFGSHYFLYFSFINLLKVESSKTKTFLALILLILPLSFFMSSFLAHRYDNFINRALYFLSGLWLGVLTNLVLAFSVTWFLKGIFGSVTSNLNWKSAALFFIFLAVAISFWGIWSARNPRVKNISVRMENLPESWKGKKIIQLSDVHLGHVYRQGFLEKIVEKINQEKPYAVFITGDLFDGMDGNLSSLVGPLNDISAPGGIYFVTGNHETYLGVEKAFSALRGTQVRILDNAAVDLSGVQIVGISYPGRGEKVDLGEKIQKAAGEKKSPRILLWHAPTQIEAAKKNGVDLQLSGHTHKGQLFPFGFITSLIYHGYDLGLRVEGNYTIYTSSGAGAWGPTMRTSARPEVVAITVD